jgi:hypothetical protein
MGEWAAEQIRTKNLEKLGRPGFYSELGCFGWVEGKFPFEAFERDIDIIGEYIVIGNIHDKPGDNG